MPPRTEPRRAEVRGADSARGVIFSSEGDRLNELDQLRQQDEDDEEEEDDDDSDGMAAEDRPQAWHRFCACNKEFGYEGQEDEYNPANSWALATMKTNSENKPV